MGTDSPDLAAARLLAGFQESAEGAPSAEPLVASTGAAQPAVYKRRKGASFPSGMDAMAGSSLEQGPAKRHQPYSVRFRPQSRSVVDT
jgi:hypothetical protein